MPLKERQELGDLVKLEKLSALAELVSAIAILVTLGYLAIQTQQNTAAIQASVRQAMLSDDMELIHQLIDYPMLFTERSSSLTPNSPMRISSVCMLICLVSYAHVRTNGFSIKTA